MHRLLIMPVALAAALVLSGCSGSPTAPPSPSTTAAAAVATTSASAQSSVGKKYLSRTPSISLRYSLCQDEEKAANRGGACAGPLTDMVLLALDIQREAPAGDLRQTAALLVDIGEQYGTNKCGNGYPLSGGSTRDAICQVNALGLDNSWQALVTRLSL